MSNRLENPLTDAIARVHYLNLIVVAAAAASDRLPYLSSQPEIDRVAFQQQLGSLACMLQVHFTDLTAALNGSGDLGRFADFRSLIADTTRRIESGDDPLPVLHRHFRNLFAFNDAVSADQKSVSGLYLRSQGSDNILAIAWFLDTLSLLEQGGKLHDMLGDAQNTDVCTRLFFGDTVDAMDAAQRDLRLIMPAGTSVM